MWLLVTSSYIFLQLKKQNIKSYIVDQSQTASNWQINNSN